MKVSNLGELAKKYHIAIIVFGGGLAALGLSGYSYGWGGGDRFKITLGVSLLILGILSLKRSQ